MCVLDFATWEAFFVCIFDGLRRPTERDRHTPESANEKTLEDIDLKAAPNSNGKFSKSDVTAENATLPDETQVLQYSLNVHP